MHFRYLAAAALALGTPGATSLAAGTGLSSPTCPVPARWGMWTDATRLPDPKAVNVLRLGPAGALFWNNAPITDGSLDGITGYLMKQPVKDLTTVLDPGGQDCGTLGKYRKKLEKTLCQNGTCLIGKGPPQPAWQPAPPPPR